MQTAVKRVLVIGYGNPGRLDDGLGPALAERLEDVPGVTVDSGYQLAVEDAAAVAEHDVVVFADAAATGPEPFGFRRVEPRANAAFTTHVLAPEALLAIAEEHLGAKTRGYLLAIRGHEFDEFGERLSSRARRHLDAAVGFLRERIANGDFEEAAEPGTQKEGG
jgi:hydrogenase maturation protease